MLVPLTGSLYVPGRLVKGSEVLVDIGAGFLVGRAPDDARGILGRKVGYLKANTESLAKVIATRENNLAAIREVMMERQRLAAAGGGGGGGGGGAAP